MLFVKYVLKIIICLDISARGNYSVLGYPFLLYLYTERNKQLRLLMTTVSLTGVTTANVSSVKVTIATNVTLTWFP